MRSVNIRPDERELPSSFSERLGKSYAEQSLSKDKKNKDLCRDDEALGELHLDITEHSKLPDAKEFKQFAADIAWETEVWLADTPEHMIHFNGDRFVGPR